MVNRLVVMDILTRRKKMSRKVTSLRVAQAKARAAIAANEGLVEKIFFPVKLTSSQGSPFLRVLPMNSR